MANGNQNGWNEYSRLVLKELETLADGIDNLKSEIQELRGEVSIIHEKENQVKELKAWKVRVDEVVSPTQLKKMSEEIEDLKAFKTKAITVFAVVQFAMAAIVFIQKFIPA